jgi:NAD(P)-dependent dehydrogenase (short-subunit alcohol dehydrogenase family)
MLIFKRFQNQFALITGASKGIGFGISQRLAKEGATIAMIDKDKDQLEISLKELKKNTKNEKHIAIDIDVSNYTSVQSCVKSVISNFGKIDILIQAAGITGKTNIKTHEVEIDDFQNVMNVNLNGIFYFCKEVLPYMVNQKYGRIINIASISGKEGNVGMLAYSTSKAAIIGLTKVIGKEYANLPNGGSITCNAISPAVIRTTLIDSMPPAQVKYMTDKIPMGRVGEIEEIAALVSFIASKEASFTTGFTFDASGGRATY